MRSASTSSVFAPLLIRSSRWLTRRRMLHTSGSDLNEVAFGPSTRHQVSGQIRGNRNITSVKTSKVSGRPTLR